MDEELFTDVDMRADMAARLRCELPGLSAIEFHELLEGIVRLRLGEQTRLRWATTPFDSRSSAFVRSEASTVMAMARISELSAEIVQRIRRSRSQLSEDSIMRMTEEYALVAYRDEERMAACTRRIRQEPHER